MKSLPKNGRKIIEKDKIQEEEQIQDHPSTDHQLMITIMLLTQKMIEKDKVCREQRDKQKSVMQMMTTITKYEILEVYWPSGPQLLVVGPSGWLDFVLRALWALRPCDPRNDVVIGQCNFCRQIEKNHRQIPKNIVDKSKQNH